MWVFWLSIIQWLDICSESVESTKHFLIDCTNLKTLAKEGSQNSVQIQFLSILNTNDLPPFDEAEVLVVIFAKDAIMLNTRENYLWAGTNRKRLAIIGWMNWTNPNLSTLISPRMNLVGINKIKQVYKEMENRKHRYRSKSTLYKGKNGAIIGNENETRLISKNSPISHTKFKH